MASFPSWSTAVNRALTSSSLRSSHEMNQNSKARAILQGQLAVFQNGDKGSSSPINFMASLSSLTSILQKPTTSPLIKTHQKKGDGAPNRCSLNSSHSMLVCHAFFLTLRLRTFHSHPNQRICMLFAFADLSLVFQLTFSIAIQEVMTSTEK